MQELPGRRHDLAPPWAFSVNHLECLPDDIQLVVGYRWTASPPCSTSSILGQDSQRDLVHPIVNLEKHGLGLLPDLGPRDWSVKGVRELAVELLGPDSKVSIGLRKKLFLEP